MTLVNTITTLPGIVADERAIRQVLLNLLSNTIKFTPAGGRIEIAAEARAEAIRLRIRDTGGGMPEEMVENLGSLFTQADPHLSRHHGGMGIGLALCRRLSEMHGGRLAISSTAEAGTTVTLFFHRESQRTEPRQDLGHSSQGLPVRA
ncbi:ATP-binding protein [Skermanella rosea]|uniref:ATP-binding protein n=1 Tax=Skermanella rosea TaxID=1817965 RepID=UPI001931A417|nr:ATP-binding protein [Skermanella rosea]UEM03256.1 ATP-binding protein [Skermanella rosea]